MTIRTHIVKWYLVKERTELYKSHIKICNTSSEPLLKHIHRSNSLQRCKYLCPGSFKLYSFYRSTCTKSKIQSRRSEASELLSVCSGFCHSSLFGHSMLYLLSQQYYNIMFWGLSTTDPRHTLNKFVIFQLKTS